MRKQNASGVSFKERLYDWLETTPGTIVLVILMFLTVTGALSSMMWIASQPPEKDYKEAHFSVVDTQTGETIVEYAGNCSKAPSSDSSLITIWCSVEANGAPTETRHVISLKPGQTLVEKRVKKLEKEATK